MILSLSEAASLVRDGAVVALGGMTLYRRPVAFVREILRRRPKDLTLASFTGGFESDLLVGAGCVSTCRSCYFGLEIFGFAPMYTALASGLKIVEETEATICGSFRGRAAIPILRDTDVLRDRPDIRVVGGAIDIPPIEIDVAILHATEADRKGRARFVGNLACDVEIASTAEQVVVTAERIVDEVEPMIEADVVVEAPKGAWPTSCYPEYTFDGMELLRYVRMCREGRFEDYLAGFLAR